MLRRACGLGLLEEGNVSDLTVVVTTRNDDHGGDLLRRTQIFVTSLLDQCRHRNLDTELIMVEWNPPADRPRLAEALHWPRELGPCTVRIIEVPPDIHSRFRYSDRLPLFQMIAKNVGIRRAQGQFVLATNIDVLFSDELMDFMASGGLESDFMYRVDRYDVTADVPLDSSTSQRLEYCRANVIRINDRTGTHSAETCPVASAAEAINGEKWPWSWYRWWRRATRRWRRRWRSRTWFGYPYMKLRRWWRTACQSWRRGEGCAGLWPAVLRGNYALQEMGVIPVTIRSRLHTNACGDFTLMDREHWFALRGYPELEVFSFHLDSVLCHAAHHSGARERVLLDPMRIYHIEHAAGSGWTPQGQKKLYERLDKSGIPQLGSDLFNAWAIQMRRERQPVIFSDWLWGLADEDLVETTII